MKEIQIIHRNEDGTVVGSLENKIYKGTPIEIPLSQLEFIEMEDKASGYVTRIRHFKGQIYSTSVFGPSEISRELENNKENKTGLPDLSRKFTDGDQKHIFYEWKELV